MQSISVHDSIAVDPEADKILDLRDEPVDTGAAVNRIDLFHRPGDVDERIAGNTHDVGRMVVAVKARDHDGIGVQTDAVAADDEERVNVVLSSGGLGCRLRRRRRRRRCAWLRRRSGRRGGRCGHIRRRRRLRLQTGIVGLGRRGPDAVSKEQQQKKRKHTGDHDEHHGERACFLLLGRFFSAVRFPGECFHAMGEALLFCLFLFCGVFVSAAFVGKITHSFLLNSVFAASGEPPPTLDAAKRRGV